MVQPHNGALRNDLLLRLGPLIFESYAQGKRTICRMHAYISGFSIKKGAIMTTYDKILFHKLSFIISQYQQYLHTFHELIPAKNKTTSYMCETNIYPSVLPYIACVIRMTASLQV